LAGGNRRSFEEKAMARLNNQNAIPSAGVWFALTALAVALAFAPTAGCVASISKARSNEDGEARTAVPTVTVSEQPMPRYLALTGSLAGNRSSQVAADGIGRVRETFIERGSVVQAGDVLLQLDVRSARLSQNEALAQAEASRSQRDRALRDCERSERLLQGRVIGQSEYDRSKAECSASQWSSEAALARAEIANKAIGDATVRAPFAGMVVERSISVGEYVRPGTPIARLVQVDPLRLELTIPESEISRVRAGQSVEFDVTAFPGERFRGTVALVSPAIREGSRDRIVEAIVANPDKRLLPGMFALARIETGRDPKPVVPASAIRGEGTKSRVFAIVDGRLEERMVQVGEREGDLYALEKGVKPGDRIARDAAQNLRDGLLVQ
jgi:RND family efflux transporter MFP subunit